VLPVLFRIGSLAVYSYGVTLALAFFACWLLARWYLPRHGVDREMATDLLLAAAIGGIIGARILYVAANWSSFAANPLWAFQLQRGGMVFYGGLAGGAAAVAGLVAYRRLPVSVIADGAAFAVPLGSAIGRLGCFLNGCCGGRATASWLGVTFPGTSGPVLPTQLIDSAANLAIMAVLLTLEVRSRPPAGALWWGFLAAYGVSRFSVEMVRTNPPLALGLTQAQWLSIPVALAGVAGLAFVLVRAARAHAATGKPAGE
jgi:phosphatidylglycerol:prolipoprotein diacylglycerol transferase